MLVLSHFLFVLLVFISEGNGYSLSSIFTGKPRPALQIGVDSSSPQVSLESPLASLFSENSRHSTESTYLHTLALLDNLRSKPSCHRDSIGNLLSSCLELQQSAQSSHIDNKKTLLASRIAFCEFESAGIDYPSECKVLKGKGNEYAKEELCMRKLAGKPQWWTTMSNSMQTVNVVCRSVGREVERDELLELHSNITNAERQLYLAIRKVLAEIFTATEYQETFSEDMNRAFATILRDMDNIRVQMRQSWRSSEDEIVGTMTEMRDAADSARKETTSTFSWLRQEIQSAHQFMAIWDNTFRQFWSEIETTGERAHANTKDLVDTVEYLTDNLKHSSADVAKIFHDVMTLAEALNEQALSTKAILESQAEQSRGLMQDLEEKLVETKKSLDEVQNKLNFSTMTMDWTVRYMYSFVNWLLVRVVICTILSLLAGMLSKGGPRRILEIAGILLCSSLVVTLPQSLMVDPGITKCALLAGAVGAIVSCAFYIREHLQTKRQNKELEREYREYMRSYAASSKHRKRASEGSKWGFKRRDARRLVL